MKKIGKLKRSFAALLLALVMLCSAVMPTVVYAAEGLADNSSGSETSSQENGAALDLEWLTIEYTEDEIVITVAPEISALLSINTSQIGSIIGKLKEALEAVVLKQIKDEWIGDNTVTPGGDPSSVSGITIDTVWEKALESYIDSNYSQEAVADRYIAFFDDIMNNDRAVAGLVEHVCNLISLAASAGVIDPADLPEANAQLENSLKNTLDTFIGKYVRNLAEDAIEDYISEVLSGESHGGSAIDDFADRFISSHFTKVIKDYLEHKSNPDPSHASDVVDKYIDSYINSVIKSSVDAYIAFKTNGTAPGLSDGFEKEAYDVISDYVSSYIETLKNDYVAYKLGAAWSHDTKLLEIVDGFLDNFISARVDAYIAYKSDENTALADADKYAAVYTSIEALVFSKCKDKLSEITGITDEDLLFDQYKNFRGDEFEEAIAGENIDYFKNTDNLTLGSADYEAFKNSVSEKDILSELNKPANRAVFDSFINAKITELQRDIAAEFFNSYSSSASFGTYVDEIIAYVMTELDESDKDAVISAVVGNDSLLGETLVALFGMGSGAGEGSAAEKAMAELDKRIAFVTAVLLYDGSVNYSDTLEELLKEPPSLTVNDLLSALESISINADLNGDGTFAGGVLFKNGSVKSEAIVDIVKDLPTLSDIADMTPDEMKLCFDVSIKSSFGSADFGVVVRFDPDVKYSELYSKINALAVILDNHFNYSYVDGTLSAEVIAPEIVTMALKRIIDSPILGDYLKEAVYSLVFGDLRGAKEFFDNLTFDEARLLLEAIDFEALILEIEDLADSNPTLRSLLDRVKAKYDYTTVTNAQILAKFDANKARFDRLKNAAAVYVEKIYNRLPESVKDKTIAEFYQGQNGGYAEFEVAFGFSFNFVVISRRIVEACPEKYKGEVVYVLDLIKQAVGDEIAGALDLTVKIPDVAKVTYLLGTTEHRVAFLPTGTNPQNFSGIDEYSGVPIVGWVDAEGNLVTSMPAEDIVLHAILDQSVTAGIDPSSREFVYDGLAHSLTANVVFGNTWQDREHTDITVEWFEGELAVGTPIYVGNSISFTDIGEYVYSCRITVENLYGKEVFLFDNSSGALGAVYAKVIAPTVVADTVITDNSGYTHIAVDKLYSNDVYYELSTQITPDLAQSVGYEWYFVPSGSTSPVLVSTAQTYTVRNVAQSGEYYAVVSYTVGGVSGSVTSDTVSIKISPITIHLDEIWNYSVFVSTAPYIAVYSGAEYNVIKDTVHGKSALDIFDVEQYKATAVGSYTARVTVKDTNYVIYGNQNTATLDWHIINDFSVLVTYNGAAVQDPLDVRISDVYSYTKSHTVALTVGQGFDSVSVAWYKQNGSAFERIADLDGALEMSFKNAETSVYKWEITVTENGYVRTATGNVTVAITPATVNVGDFTWSGDVEFTFNGSSHSAPTVSYTVPTDLSITVDYAITTGGAAVSSILLPGDYTVTANLSIAGNTNYVLSSSSASVDVKVNKATFDASSVHWNYDGEPIEFDEAEHSVLLVGLESYPLIEVRYATDSVNTATEVGKYVAKFEKFVVVIGDNEYALENCYVLLDSEETFPHSIEWEIVPKPTPIEKDEYIFDEGGIYVKVKDSAGNLLGYNIRVVAVDGYDIITLVDGRKMQVAKAYDVVFENENGDSPEYSEDMVFTVTFKLPEGLDLDKLEIVYIDPQVTDHVDVISYISEDRTEINFETSHFSIFAIATEYIEPETPPTPDDPDNPVVPPTDPGDDDHFDFRWLLLLLALVVILVVAILLGKRRKGGRYAPWRFRPIDDTTELYEDLKKVSWAKTPTVFIDGKSPDHVVISTPIKTVQPASSIATLKITETAGGRVASKPTEEMKKPLISSRIAVVERFEDGANTRIRKVDAESRSVDAYSVTRINDADVLQHKVSKKAVEEPLVVAEARSEADTVVEKQNVKSAFIVKETHEPIKTKAVAPETVSNKKEDVFKTEIVKETVVEEAVDETKIAAPETATEAPAPTEQSEVRAEQQAEEIDLPYLSDPSTEKAEDSVETVEDIPVEDTPVEITAKDIPEIAPIENTVEPAPTKVEKAVAKEPVTKTAKADVIENKKAVKPDVPTEAEKPVSKATPLAVPMVMSAEEPTVTDEPVEETPVEVAPIEDVPTTEAPIEEVPTEEATTAEAPIVEAPIEEAPIVEAPIEEVPTAEAPVVEEPIEDAPVEEAPVDEVPVEEVPVEVSIEDTFTVEELPVASAIAVATASAVAASVLAESSVAPETAEPVSEANGNIGAPDVNAAPTVEAKRPSGVVKQAPTERKIIKASELDVPVTVFMAGDDVDLDDEDSDNLPDTPDVDTSADIDAADKDSDDDFVAPISDRTPEDDDVARPEPTAPEERIDLSSISKKPVDDAKLGLGSERRYPKGRLSVEDMKKSIPHHTLNPEKFD